MNFKKCRRADGLATLRIFSRTVAAAVAAAAAATAAAAAYTDTAAVCC